MHQAKSAGRSTVLVVDDAIRARARARLDIETGLRDAIDAGQLELHYQPQVSLRTRALVGVEALVRWRHPELGLVLPVDFIGVAEESGLIDSLGRWVLERACGELRELRVALGDPTLTMSVNVSTPQLVRGSMVADAVAALDRAGVEGAGLCIEITESILLEAVAAAVENLEALKATGVRISVDDFGTGYSSLAYIGRLPIDELKIDRSFVAEMDGERGAALVRGIVSLAKALGYTVVAEGVETASQLHALTADGCDLAQGWYLGRPAPLVDLLPQLASPSWT